MPQVSRLGRVAMGIDGYAISVDGDELTRSAGNPHWLDDDTLVFQRLSVQSAYIERMDVDSYRSRVLDSYGANAIVAGDGVWAVWSTAHGYRDSHGHQSSAWYPVSVVSGEIIIKRDHQGPDVYSAISRDGTTLTPLSGIPNRYAWTCGHRAGFGLCAWHVATPHQGIVLSADGRDFHPDLAELAGRPGHLRVASSTGAGERPDELRVYDIDLSGMRVRGPHGEYAYTLRDLTHRPVTVPEFVRCDRPMAVGAWFDHDEAFLTHIPDGTGRWPQDGPSIKGVFVDSTHREHLHASIALTHKLGVPLYIYFDSRPADFSLVPSGAIALIHGYLTPGSSLATFTDQMAAETSRAQWRGLPWGLAISLHRGPDGASPPNYARGEQETLDAAAVAWRMAVERGARIVYVFAQRRPYPSAVPLDGIDAFPSFGLAYLRMHKAVPDAEDWPRIEVRPVPTPAPTPVPPIIPAPAPPPTPTPDPSRFARARSLTLMPDTYLIRLRHTSRDHDVSRVLSVDPAIPDVVDEREVGRDWETAVLARHGTKWTAFFRDAQKFLCITDLGDLETRNEAGVWERFEVAEQPPDWTTIFLYRAGVPVVLQVEVL